MPSLLLYCKVLKSVTRFGLHNDMCDCDFYVIDVKNKNKMIVCLFHGFHEQEILFLDGSNWEPLGFVIKVI